VGTPTNLVFRQVFPQFFPGAPGIGFAQWMLLGVPLSLVFVLAAWWLFVRVLFPLPDAELLGGRDTIAELRARLGPVRRDELVAGGVFLAAALLWITGKSLDLGALRLPGWQELFGGRVDDPVVAIALASLLFVLPSAERRGQTLLEWEHTQQVPWGILLLFGGGFALATGFEASGLSSWAAGLFLGLSGSEPLLVVAVVCAIVVLTSEFASNTATAQIALPILKSASLALAIDPRLLMVPATLAASCGFALPVGTPPSAIVYSTGYVPMRAMVRAGIVLDLLGIALIILFTWLLAGPAFGIDASALPVWAPGPR
jgi:sodium-dependent dicarboxylate transporter 2/3/5